MRRSVIIIAAMLICYAAVQSFGQGARPRVERHYFNHSAWTKGIFSEAVTVTGIGSATFIYLAGVGAEDENGPRGNIRFHGDLVAQCHYAFDKIKRVLAAHGSKIGDTVKVTSYLTDMRNRIEYGKCIGEEMGNASLPAQTLLNVSSLAFPEMMIEVDVTAIASR